MASSEEGTKVNPSTGEPLHDQSSIESTARQGPGGRVAAGA
ncbi:hypothetical protein HaLaN_11336, partial [Haematococcus lacustris]